MRTKATEHDSSPWTSVSRKRHHPWSFDKEMYRRHNELERPFRRLKGFRTIFTRYDQLDVMFAAFIHFALTPCEQALHDNLR